MDKGTSERGAVNDGNVETVLSGKERKPVSVGVTQTQGAGHLWALTENRGRGARSCGGGRGSFQKSVVLSREGGSPIWPGDGKHYFSLYDYLAALKMSGSAGKMGVAGKKKKGRGGVRDMWCDRVQRGEDLLRPPTELESTWYGGGEVLSEQQAQQR